MYARKAVEFVLWLAATLIFVAAMLSLVMHIEEVLTRAKIL